MKKKILSESEVLELFNEVLKHPLFVLELNEYEKSKILEIALNERNRIQVQASKFINNPLDTSVLSDIESFRLHLISTTDIIDNFRDVSEENKLYYFLMEISENAISLKVLFHNLGINWNLSNGQIRAIEEPQPEVKGLEIDTEIKERLINDLLPYFKKEEHKEKLKLLIEGHKIQGKVDFYGMAKQLIGVFVNIKNGGNYLLQIQKQDIAKWLSDNFKYWNKSEKKYLPIKFETARNSFSASKADYFLPDKEDEISSIY